MSDDEAASAVAALPHEIAERTPLGIFLDAVVDVHSDNNVEKNAGGGNTKNTPLGGVVSTSVHPREETMMRHHKPDALESVEYSADGTLFASISSEKNAVRSLR